MSVVSLERTTRTKVGQDNTREYWTLSPTLFPNPDIRSNRERDIVFKEYWGGTGICITIIRYCESYDQNKKQREVHYLKWNQDP